MHLHPQRPTRRLLRQAAAFYAPLDRPVPAEIADDKHVDLLNFERADQNNNDSQKS